MMLIPSNPAQPGPSRATPEVARPAPVASPAEIAAPDIGLIAKAYITNFDANHDAVVATRRSGLFHRRDPETVRSLESDDGTVTEFDATRLFERADQSGDGNGKATYGEVLQTIKRYSDDGKALTSPELLKFYSELGEKTTAIPAETADSGETDNGYEDPNGPTPDDEPSPSGPPDGPYPTEPTPDDEAP